jgi:hypothetical protein
MAAKAVVRRSSSVRGFLVRRAAKLWSNSCSRRRGSCWVVGLRGEGAEVGARRRQELTGEKGNDGEVVLVEVWLRGVAGECQ